MHSEDAEDHLIMHTNRILYTIAKALGETEKEAKKYFDTALKIAKKLKDKNTQELLEKAKVEWSKKSEH